MEESKLDIQLNSVRRAFVTANYMYIYYKVTSEDGYTILIPEKQNEQRVSDSTLPAINREP